MVDVGTHECVAIESVQCLGGEGVVRGRSVREMNAPVLRGRLVDP